MSEHTTPFGERLRHARESAGLSRSALALRAGLDVSHLYRIELGGRRPSRESALSLAEAIGLTGEARDQWLASAGYAPMPLTGAVRGAVRTRASARRPVSSALSDQTAVWTRLEGIGLQEPRLARLLAAVDASPAAQSGWVADRVSDALTRLAEQLETPVKCAVIPAAGGQHRMLAPHVMQRLLLRVIREASEAGISRVVLVLAPGSSDALYTPLKEALDLAIIPPIDLLQRIQPHPVGLGDAILEAEPDVGGGPFAVLLPDDVLVERRTRGSRGMSKAWRSSEDAHIVAVTPAPRSRMVRAGVAVLGVDQVAPQIFPVSQLAERPPTDHAVFRSSHAYAIVGRYLLQPAIFDALRDLRSRKVVRVELTDALEARRRAGDRVCAIEVDSPRPDLDNLLGHRDEVV